MLWGERGKGAGGGIRIRGVLSKTASPSLPGVLIQEQQDYQVAAAPRYGRTAGLPVYKSSRIRQA